MSDQPSLDFPQEIREIIKDIIIHNNERKIRQLQKLTKFILSSSKSIRTKGEAIRVLHPILEQYTHISSHYSPVNATHNDQLEFILKTFRNTNERRSLPQSETSSKASDPTSSSTKNYNFTTNFNTATTDSPSI